MNPSNTSRPNSGGQQGEKPPQQKTRRSPFFGSPSERQADSSRRKRPHAGYATLPGGETADAGDMQLQVDPIPMGEDAGLLFPHLLAQRLAADSAGYSLGGVGPIGGMLPKTTRAQQQMRASLLPQGETGGAMFPPNYLLHRLSSSQVSPESPLDSRTFFPVVPEQHQEQQFPPTYFQPTSPNEQIDQHQSPWDLKLESPLVHQRRKSTGKGASNKGLSIHSVPINYNRQKIRRRQSYMSDPGKQEWDSQPAMDTAGHKHEAKKTPPLSDPLPGNTVMGAAATGGSQKKRLIDNSTFPIKLHGILADSSCTSIHWLPSGKSWKVVNPTLFEQEVLPRYFRSSRYASFMRQVNGWGFRRVVSGPDQNAYYNEFFIRDKPELCTNMQRMKSERRKAPPDTYSPGIPPEPEEPNPEKQANEPYTQRRPSSVPAIVTVQRSAEAAPPLPLIATRGPVGPQVLHRSSSTPAYAPRSQKVPQARKDPPPQPDGRQGKQVPRTRSFESLGSSCFGSWEDSVNGSHGLGNEAHAQSDLLEPSTLSDAEPLSPGRLSSAGLLSPDEKKPSAPATDSSLNNTQPNWGND